jgi:predicted short-subunit dehydrogenase-like oxidoreductase (DUF2520 family)
MRQVPRYLIVGNGRVARHFCHYLSLLDIQYSQWHRPQSIGQLAKEAATATHILVLIMDSAIEPFIASHLAKTPAVKIHFSGALVTGLAHGAHPLMTFGKNLYTLEKYRSIPFIADTKENLLPGLPNQQFFLPPDKKALYHAYCVLAGNFSCLLWQKFFNGLGELNLPPEAGQPYLRQQTENLLEDYKSALTGPLVRGDQLTIDRNLLALENDPFQQVYKSFVEAYHALPGVKHAHNR